MNTDRMDCDEALALLQDYLKVELSTDNQARVAQHLSACGHCLGHAQFERNFLAAVERATRGVECPDELVARILQALRSGTQG